MQYGAIITLLDEKYDTIKEMFQQIKDHWSLNQSKEKFIYGAGEWGRAVYWRLKHLGISIDYFVDSDESKSGKEIVDGVRCLSPKEMLADGLQNKIIVMGIGNEEARKAVMNELKKKGCTEVVESIVEDYQEQCRLWGWSEGWLQTDLSDIKESIKDFWDCLEDEESKNILYQKIRFLLGEKVDFAKLFSPNQYFLEDGKYLGKHEVILDCGAYTGDTLSELVGQMKYQDFDKYYCFEMDTDNIKLLEEKVHSCLSDIQNRIELVQAAVGAQDRVCSYSMNLSNSRIEDGCTGDGEGKMISLDSFLKSEKVTFIKMDIEGYEKEALMGCKRIMQEQKPQLAICIYHKVEDIWEIPQYIKSIVPEYKFMIRHHAEDETETVLYARVEGFDRN